MALPNVKSKKGVNIEEYSWLIYGDPKIGKSTFCSQMKDVLIFDTQKGYKHLDVFKYDIASWQDFLDGCKDIVEASRKGELKFKVAAIDIVDDLYKLCFDHVVVTKLNGFHPGEVNDFGKSWGVISDSFNKVIAQLQQYITLVFVSHAEMKDIEMDNIKYNKIVPTFSGGGKTGSKAFVNSIVDGILYITTDSEGNQIVKSRGGCYLMANSRSTDVLEPEMPLSYDYICDLFEKKKKSEGSDGKSSKPKQISKGE